MSIDTRSSSWYNSHGMTVTYCILAVVLFALLAYQLLRWWHDSRRMLPFPPPRDVRQLEVQQHGPGGNIIERDGEVLMTAEFIKQGGSDAEEES